MNTSFIVCAVIVALAAPIITVASYLLWECWKTAHRPGYQSPLVHG